MFLLSSRSILSFPHPFHANEDGLLAIGGDLNTQRLILAYRFGIFPWYSSGQPILWWSPKERFILDTDRIHVPKSMRKYLNNPIFKITTDQHFDYVIDRCQNINRPHQDGTWITPELKKAYCELHRQGIAHSIEIWKENEIVGGLYGIGMGGIFSGESMFSELPDASKYGVLALGHILREKQYVLIDSQHYSPHMELLGGYSVTHTRYFDRLRANLKVPLDTKHWHYNTPVWLPVKK